jgi:hypothetical protein
LPTENFSSSITYICLEQLTDIVKIFHFMTVFYICPLNFGILCKRERCYFLLLLQQLPCVVYVLMHCN